MDEENKIKEAETEAEKEASLYDIEEETDEMKEEESEKPRKKGKVDFYVELALFLILGTLVGIAVKTEAVKRITMGYDDYKMKIIRQDYNINSLQEEVIKKSLEVQRQEEENPVQGEEIPADGENQGN